MQLNQVIDTVNTKLVIDGHEIVVVDDFKYPGSHVESIEKDINNIIALAWTVIARLKPITRATRP